MGAQKYYRVDRAVRGEAKVKLPSSAIAATSYDPMTRTLGVTYPSGVAYSYTDVPAHVAAAFDRAESKGAFLVKHIKGKYETVKAGDI